MRLVWDIETNGLLDELTKIHCIVAIDPDTGREYIYRPHQIDAGLKLLAEADVLIGHNILDFDLRAITKLHPEWSTRAECIDTLTVCRLHRPDLNAYDTKLINQGKMPAMLRNRQSLKAWGYRIGVHKASFGETADWEVFTEEMLEYCVQDVKVNVALWHFLERQKLAPQALAHELDLAPILIHQEDTGFGFDREGCLALLETLENRDAELIAELRKWFPAWWQPSKVRTIKVTMQTKLPWFPDVTIPRWSKDGKRELKPYVGPPKCDWFEGNQYQKITWSEFSGRSRHLIGDRLEKVYGWQPEKRNKDGSPVLDDVVLRGIPPEVMPDGLRDVLLEFLAVGKVLGYVKAWLKAFDKDTGAIHGRVTQNGAVTGRATHSSPNIAQVPKVLTNKEKEILLGYEGGWGYECRSLFRPHIEGNVLVGCDMQGLELRMLAHYLAVAVGDSSYIDIVINQDPHEFHRELAGLPTRDVAKTWVYAFIYGAGLLLLGLNANPDLQDAHELVNLGRRLKNTFLKRFVSLNELAKLVKKVANERKYIVGLDGRRIYVAKDYTALNYLLQGGGAVACKRWLIEINRLAAARGLTLGKDYWHHAWVHDEVQLSTRPELGDTIGKITEDAASITAEVLGLRCPLAGKYQIGSTWAATH